MSQQISLPLRLQDWASFENFYLAPGSAALALPGLLQSADWQVAYLSGAASSGKTHLLHACCRYWQEQRQAQVIYLPLAELAEAGPVVLDGIQNYALVALDDLDSIAGDSGWEEGIFHLFNALQIQGGRLLIAAQAPPASLAVQLPDLRSRLLSGSSWRLEPLDEPALRQALTGRAERLGLVLPAGVLDYLFRRFSRDSRSLFGLLDQLDRYAFEHQRQLTLPLVRAFLQQQEGV